MATSTKKANWLKKQNKKTLPQKRGNNETSKDLEQCLHHENAKKLRRENWVKAWMGTNYRM